MPFRDFLNPNVVQYVGVDVDDMDTLRSFILTFWVVFISEINGMPGREWTSIFNWEAQTRHS